MPAHWDAFCSALESRMAHTAPGRRGAQLVPSYWGEMEPAAAELGRRAAVWGQTSLFSTKPVLPHVFFMKNPLVMWSCRVPWKQGRFIQWPKLSPAWCDRDLSPSCLVLMQTGHSMMGKAKSLQASGLLLPPLSAPGRAVPIFGLLMAEKWRGGQLCKAETEVWGECSRIAPSGVCSHPQPFVIAKNGALQIPWRHWRQTYASSHQEVCLDSQPRSKGSVHYLLSSSSPPLT